MTEASAGAGAALDARYAAIDLGGTKILSIVSDGDGGVLGEDRRPTEAGTGESAVIGRMVESLRAAIKQSRLDPATIKALGVSAAGPTDFEHGILLEPPNLPGWQEVPLAARLRELTGLPTVLENDANCAAVGEWRLGAGRGTRHMIYMTVSTGIGGGLILDGRLYRGADGTAGEIGHMIVDAEGPPCGCGMRGCLEAVASGTAIGRMAREAAADGRSARLREIAAREELDARDVAEAAEAGDEAAREVIARAGRYLGLGLAGLINLFNPESIVVGGGASRIGPRLLEPAFSLARQLAFKRPAARVRLETAALRGYAEALGAAALAAGQRLA
ncbi:MAG: ROK family protein [Chloroflexi bacterium]|nr:ROK family protein [Chloroflexota bacterium]